MGFYSEFRLQLACLITQPKKVMIENQVRPAWINNFYLAVFYLGIL